MMECSSPLELLVFPSLRESHPDTLDIHFIFREEDTGEEKKLGAHKLFLALSSEVFVNQFFKQFAEAKQGTVTVTDSTFKTFKVFLDHIYGIKVPWSSLSHSSLYKLFELANKYQMNSLAESVCKFVSEMKVKSENILEVASIAQSIQFIDALNFSESLHASVAKVSVDTFTEIICTAFDQEDISLLHNFLSKVEDNLPFQNIKEELNSENILNLLNQENMMFSILRSFIVDNLPMSVTQLFSQVPSEGDNSSQLFHIMKLGFKSSKIDLEQLDGAQVKLEIRPWDTIKTVSEKVRMIQRGCNTCKRGEVEMASVEEKNELVFCDGQPNCEFVIKAETKLENNTQLIADIHIKPTSISHKLIQKSAVITVHLRSSSDRDLHIEVSSDTSIKDIKIKVNRKLGFKKRKSLRITTWTKSGEEKKILEDKVTVKDLVMKEEHWGVLLVCKCSTRKDGDGCIKDRFRWDPDYMITCRCRCHG